MSSSAILYRARCWWFLALSVMPVFSYTARAQKFTEYVDPFIGTAAHGHTFPGATLPFGMVQLSPDTGTEGWDWCSGYHSSDESVMGFSHTHLSGTGIGDMGDILVMPFTGEWKTRPGSKENPDEGYRSRFRQETEKASPGYYSVMLDDYQVKAELTATLRTGLHRYTFPGSGQSNLIIDLEHGISDKATETRLEITGDGEVAGMRRSTGWAKDQRVYFVARFSKPFTAFAVAEGDEIREGERETAGKASKALLRFRTKADEEILVKVGISSVSLEGARKNLNAELPHWRFDRVRKEAAAIWETELERIEVREGSDTQMRIFYTALYHTMIHPNTAADVDGQYLGLDQEIHKTDGFTYYTVFSLWDTFRALHPLFEIIIPERNADFIRSMLAQYQQSGKLPVWELKSNETNTMIGYHSVPVIAGALLKGDADLDEQQLYKAMAGSAMRDGEGLDAYKQYGYIPRELEKESVSKTMEYAYDDWCIAQVAKKLEKEDDYKYFASRSLNYRNLLDTTVNLVRPRDQYGDWLPDFDPSEVVSDDFTEGNAWQYTFFAPHDVNGLIERMGGDSVFVEKLDAFFTETARIDQEKVPDVTGLIGQYAHGNEPSHHIAYLYNYAGQPWKTQKLVRQIMNDLYTTGRDGLSGNEDCGQMSAWYVFSAMGFYPVNPASGRYAIGSPLFEKVRINLPGKRNRFDITAKDASFGEGYVQYTGLNNKLYRSSYLRYKDITAGRGKFFFKIVSVPSYEWAISPGSRPRDRAVPEDSGIKVKIQTDEKGSK